VRLPFLSVFARIAIFFVLGVTDYFVVPDYY